MKFSIKQTAIVAGLALASAVPSAQAMVLTFSSSSASAATSGPCSGIGWTSGNEFRMCDPSGAALGGGFLTQKDVITGGETYAFNNAGQLAGVTGTPSNPGSDYVPVGSAAPVVGTNVTLHQNTSYFGALLNFLAPTVGSLAGTAYGVGTSLTSAPVNGATTLMHFNVLEAQWAGAYFPLGLVGGGIDFTGVISGASTVGDVTTFNFDVFATHTIAELEDPGVVGFTGWTAQWHLQGTGVFSAVPEPSISWLLGSGLLGLIGVTRRKRN